MSFTLWSMWKAWYCMTISWGIWIKCSRVWSRCPTWSIWTCMTTQWLRNPTTSWECCMLCRHWKFWTDTRYRIRKGKRQWSSWQGQRESPNLPKSLSPGDTWSCLYSFSDESVNKSSIKYFIGDKNQLMIRSIDQLISFVYNKVQNGFWM